MPFLDTSGVSSLFGENRAVFQAQLNRKATKLLLGAFDGLIPASVYYELEFVGQMQAYNIKVSADWSQVYEFVQNRFNGNFVFFDVEIDKMFSELEEQEDHQDRSRRSTRPRPTSTPSSSRPSSATCATTCRTWCSRPSSSPRRTRTPSIPKARAASTAPSTAWCACATSPTSGRASATAAARSTSPRSARSRPTTPSIAPSPAASRRRRICTSSSRISASPGTTSSRSCATSTSSGTSVDFSVSVVADFEGDGIDTVVVDVQYSDTFDPAPDTEANPDAQWSFLFKSADQVFRKSAWFNPDIGNNFFYRYRVFFKPDALPGPSATAESLWRALKSQDIIANTRELFERERVTIEAVGQFPWNRYPQVLARVRYDDPVSSWLHEEAKLLSTGSPVLETEFRQRAKDGISPEYQFHYIRNDGEVIETAWQPVTGPLTVVHNPDPPQLEVQFVVSPATRLGMLILNLRYEDPPNGVFEDASFVFNAENAFKPQNWRIPWKDPSKRRYFMQQTIIDADGNVTDTGMVESEGRTKVLGRRLREEARGADQADRTEPREPASREDHSPAQVRGRLQRRALRDAPRVLRRRRRTELDGAAQGRQQTRVHLAAHLPVRHRLHRVERRPGRARRLPRPELEGADMSAAMRDPAAPEAPQLGLVPALGLLAGLGGAARGLAATEVAATEGPARTCIDAGRGTLVTLRAPGPVGIAFAEATGPDPAPNVRRWRRRAIGPASEAGESLIFGAPTPEHWPVTRDYLPELGALGEALVTLRGRGRIYMATRREPETGESWIAFALHPRQSPRETLAAIGRTGVWHPVSACLTELFGRPATEHLRPWSIALPLGAAARARGLVRLGTTAWARVGEDRDKVARLARQIGRLGGDGSIAEAAYGLVARHAGPTGAVGAACEFDIEDGRVAAALYTLRTSARPAAARTERDGEA